MNYADKLKDPRWQKVRLKVFERADWKCEGCGSSDETLHVHHLVYSKGEPWDSPIEYMESLCENCHQFREDFNKLFGRNQCATEFCMRFFCHFQPVFDGDIEPAKKGELVGSVFCRCTDFHFPHGNAVDALVKRTVLHGTSQ